MRLKFNKVPKTKLNWPLPYLAVCPAILHNYKLKFCPVKLILIIITILHSLCSLPPGTVSTAVIATKASTNSHEAQEMEGWNALTLLFCTTIILNFVLVFTLCSTVHTLHSLT